MTHPRYADAIARLAGALAAGRGGVLAVVGPRGSGRTTVAEAAIALATARGLPVRPEPGRPALIVIDDPVPPDPAEVRRLAAAGNAVLVTSAEPLGLDPELRLGGLTAPELAALLGLAPDAVHAIWLASGGLPGPALALAEGLPPGAGAAEVVERALAVPARTAFLEPDTGLVRLLEAYAGDRPPALSRLARELLADPTAGARRRELVDRAVASARAAGDPGTLARVLDDGLHACWDPAAAVERLTVSAEIIELARRAGDARTELRGLLWRFTAQAELADLDGAEVTLGVYRRAGELAGDAEAAVVVTARQAMLATIRGRFGTAEALTAQIAERGRRAGLADTDRLVASLTGHLALLRGTRHDGPERLHRLARRLPGHFFEATAALTLAAAGRTDEAALDLARLLPPVLAGTGPRWLGAVADLAMVAHLVGDRAAAERLYAVLLPFAGRLVVWGGGNTITGPVDDLLGRLSGDAHHLDAAITLERRLGTLPWLVSTLRARGTSADLAEATQLATRLGLPAPADNPRPRGARPGHPGDGRPLARDGDVWGLLRDGDGWWLGAGGETARLRDGRGVRFLRALLAAPGREIAALDLVAGGAGLVVPVAEPVLDGAARTAYRRRLVDLDAEVEAADRAGDVDGSARAQAERAALIGELRRATGLGGRPRRAGDEAERARVNATRAVRAAIDRVAATAPLAAAHLAASVRTGHRLRYQPAAGGPAGWRLD
ncbi:hypothetical protein [Catenuloplanes atrovinosus]|uniref:Uncharacterized protein n=1 Tax=Catenuloplanes atrovinosus TaxID=137266 RepID=A0AAE4C9E9_9ACTN|nr:hypothetical protein [Catenuloplanes atrovinosus]MDR7276461.1 hypothetical protein [Catenuloplanes atrovinosus]